MTSTATPALRADADSFIPRHIGPSDAEVAAALFDAVRREDGAAATLPTDPDLLATAAAVRRRYEDAAWTWRR